MAVLKIWIGAALAIVLFLAIQVVLDQQAEPVTEPSKNVRHRVHAMFGSFIVQPASNLLYGCICK